MLYRSTFFTSPFLKGKQNLEPQKKKGDLREKSPLVAVTGSNPGRSTIIPWTGLNSWFSMFYEKLQQKTKSAKNRT